TRRAARDDAAGAPRRAPAARRDPPRRKRVCAPDERAACAQMSVGSAAVLQCRDLRLRYGSVVALDGLSLDVAPGRLTGFVGPNRAGKRSTMRIVLGVLGADAGPVTWHGEPLGPDAHRRFGYMPEERGLYPKMRIADQLIYLARLHGLDGLQARR